ncbi:hypothetical protein MTO96_007941 [Rhipicephalus appendiculatus]
MLLRLLSAACLVAAAAVASPRPPEEEAFEVDRKSPSTPLLAKKGGVASSASDSCSLDATLASMTMGDMERLIERFAKLQGMTVSGVVKQLYSALYSSIKRKVAGEEGLSPMALEAIQELCLGGAGPAYQLVPPHGPIFSGLSSAFMPNTDWPRTPAEEAASLHLGFSATRACYIVESVAGVRASPERAWKITIWDRFGKLVYDDICLPSKDDDLVVQPRMKITLTYVETKRKTQ